MAVQEQPAAVSPRADRVRDLRGLGFISPLGILRGRATWAHAFDFALKSHSELVQANASDAQLGSAYVRRRDSLVYFQSLTELISSPEESF